MNTPIQYYRWMTALAALLLLGLVAIQFNWLHQAKRLQSEQKNLHYLRTTPELALAIDREFRDYFHAGDSLLPDIDVDKVAHVVDSFMAVNGTTDKTFFAIYQDTIDGMFISNTEQFREELRESSYKHCMTCLISFSFARDKNLDKLYPELTISRPASNYLQLPGSSSEGELIWLSIFAPVQASFLMNQLTTIFMFSLVMLAMLVSLFYYLLRAFSKHKKMSQVKVDFLNNLNHEFKTPLSSIHLASRVLRKSKDEKKNATYLDLIERESKTLEERLTRVLELSLIDKENIPVRIERVDIHQILKEVTARMRMLIDEKSAEVNHSFHATRSIVMADRTQMTNCFYNLLENALKYGGQAVRIEMETKELQDKLQIAVRDSGPGINKKNQEDVFERFYRIQKNDSYTGKGFGIGLSYVKAVVESYQGTIRINPDFKRGSEFVIQFSSVK